MNSPTIGLIGGSGFADLLAGTGETRRHEMTTPFGPPSDAVLETEWDGLRVLLLSRHGPGHLLRPSQVPFRANLFALKQLGCTHLIASGAVGSLRQEMAPRHLVVPDQIIDKTFARPATFFESAAVHVEMAEPFCPVLRRILVAAGQELKSMTIHDRGCYVCMEGPAFSTRAESLMHRLWGGDLIGMTAMPEAKLAREAEIPYALVALVTDYDSWRPAKTGTDAQTLLQEIIENLRAASSGAMELIRAALCKIATDPAPLADCPARSALKLAIWSDKSRIAPEEIARLAPLWGGYFG
jgi:5'-methylthioadenosine phosphorylase